jgi:hypothetical protein
MRQRLYEAQCLKCQDNVHSAQQEFDKAILSLSAGLLGLSLAFIKDIVPLSQATALFLLYLSWVLSAGAVLLTLVSFWASKRAFNAQLGALYDEYFGTEQTPQPTRAALVTRWLTYGEGGCFALAVLLTVTFAIVNVRTSSVMAVEDRGDSITTMSKHSETPAPEKRGVEPSRPIQLPRPNPGQGQTQSPKPAK